MKLVADVKCYHCGFVSGEIVGDHDGTLRTELFRPAAAYARPLPDAGEPLRCGRCGGPVYLENAREYHPRNLEPIPRARRSRPARDKALAKASWLTQCGGIEKIKGR